MEAQIQKVMQETGMDRLQAYYHVRAREQIIRSPEFRRAGISHLMK